MTTKEFDQQKQAIINEFSNLGLAGVSFAEGQKLILLVNQLQPPRPTCSTCEYFNSYLWNQMDGDGDISFCYNKIIDCEPLFGCIYHSSDGDEKSKKISG